VVAQPGPSVVVRVPGKINLHLGVGPLGADGYHPVVSVFHAVSVFDDVRAEPADEIRLALHDATPTVGDEVPLGPGNLAHRAAVLLAREAGIRDGVALTLEKRIPVAAGMAGGSADAAASLVACNAVWDARLSRDDLHDLAAQLGSDVPFALLGGTALGLGRGEQLTPVLARGTYSWVLVLADGGLSTPAVYGEYDRMLEELPQDSHLLRPAVARPDDLLAALAAGDAEALGAALGNDLQLPALRLRPALREVVELGDELGALGTLVSGSGPTVAMLAAAPEDAERLAAAVAKRRVGRAVVVADGPVPGARLLDQDEMGPPA
jgi:4-diphosphocytidyl-2-C-methyl-D-erythritol kinase